MKNQPIQNLFPENTWFRHADVLALTGKSCAVRWLNYLYIAGILDRKREINNGRSTTYYMVIKPERKEVKQRKCLSCGSFFYPQHRHNFLCCASEYYAESCEPDVGIDYVLKKRNEE